MITTKVSERMSPAGGFLGRESEQAQLLGLLEEDGPSVLFLHGLAGMGKTSLVGLVSARARRQGAVVVRLDGNLLEPTPAGFMGALAIAVGGGGDAPPEVIRRLGGLGKRVVLVVDTYELLRLIDHWVRLELVPALPANVKLFIAGREPALAAWLQAVPRSSDFRTIELRPLDEESALAVLAQDGVPSDAAKRLNRVARGHPLALRVAAGAMRGPLDPGLEQAASDRVVEELTRIHVEGLDNATRHCLEAASVVRRVTRPLLQAMLPDVAPQDAYDRLSALAFVQPADDGLRLHDSIQRALAGSFRAADPESHRHYRRAAFGQIRSALRTAPDLDLWRYTADSLFLLENPAVREAFFPTTSHVYAIEPARPTDGAGIADIARRHLPGLAAERFVTWWARLPGAFRVAREGSGELAAFSLFFEPTEAIPSWMESDPLIGAFWRHLGSDRIPRHQTSLFIGGMVTREHGEMPSPLMAALWLDVKRLYVELRPRLRRVYSSLGEPALDVFGPAMTTLGFRYLSAALPVIDTYTFHPLMLDFGPSSVDGWLSWVIASELGVEEPELLDRRLRQLVMDGVRVDLTRQEFDVLQYLAERQDRVVTREELLADVWGHSKARGSNVVDATVKLLRNKLGARANALQTVRGMGYRFHS